MRLRSSIPQDYKCAADKSICEKILASEEYGRAKVIAAFYPVSSEVGILPVLRDSVKNKILLLPVCTANGIMIFRRLSSFDMLECGKYNIPQPNGSCGEWEDLKLIDFMLVPGLAFDGYGNRIGYGGGYYDRILCRLSADCTTCGVGYAVQQTDRIPAMPHDIKIKMFVCED